METNLIPDSYSWVMDSRFEIFVSLLNVGSTFEYTHVDEMSHVNDQGTFGYGWKTSTPFLSDRFLKPLTIIFHIRFPALIQNSIYSPVTNNQYYYTSDSLWKIWLVESIQSIHNSLWTWHDKCNICRRYYIYHVKFNVCLVTKPFGVFSSETKWLNVSLLFLRMNYVKNVYSNNYWIRFSHDIMNYQNLVSVSRSTYMKWSLWL